VDRTDIMYRERSSGGFFVRYISIDARTLGIGKF